MRYTDNGIFYSVAVSAAELRDFATRWPLSGMRRAARGMWFQFDKRSGDLVSITGERGHYDGGAVLALSHDAQEWGRPFTVCTNCGGPLPEGHGFHGRKTPHLRFCDACAGIAEALYIGNPHTRTALLYDGGKGCATTWTGLGAGQIVHKQGPISRSRYLDPRDPRGARRFAPVRYRVRMLDGSLWHGSGPTANGNYIRLRRMRS